MFVRLEELLIEKLLLETVIPCKDNVDGDPTLSSDIVIFSGSVTFNVVPVALNLDI